MKVCITSSGTDLNAPIDPRFGRAAYFIIVDTDTMEYQSFPNLAANATGGAGIQAAQFVASQGVQAIISGDFGPNASMALSSAGIQMIMGATGTVTETIEKFKKGELASGTQRPEGYPPPPTNPAYGYGMGYGRGRGGGWAYPPPPPPPGPPPYDEIAQLRNDVQELRKKIEELIEKIG